MLGCAGSSFDAERALACSSYLLEGSDAAVLLDCGFGSFESFTSLAPETRLDAVVLSHAHPDHVADLERFLAAPACWRERPRVLAARATIEALAFDPRSFASDVTYVVDGERFSAGTFVAEFSSTRHQIPTLGVQVTLDASRVVYSSDTGPGWRFPSSFVRADLAVVECTFDVRDETSTDFHLDAREAAELADQLSASVTLLTHVPPGENADSRLESVRRWAPGRCVEMAEVGAVLFLS